MAASFRPWIINEMLGDKKIEEQMVGGIDKFYSGFAEIGASYHKKTGKSTTFYPIYISKKKRKLFVGDGIKYNASTPKAEEKRRIANLLHERMQQMANDCAKKSDKEDNFKKED